MYFTSVYDGQNHEPTTIGNPQVQTENIIYYVVFMLKYLWNPLRNMNLLL